MNQRAAIQTDNHAGEERVPHLVISWVGLTVPPLAWSMQMGVRLALQPWICTHDAHWISDLAAVIAILLSLAGGVLAWQRWRALRSEAPPHRSSQIRQRALFMARLGVWSCALFVLVTVAQWIPERIFSACPQ
jgi:hypothetical protein